MKNQWVIFDKIGRGGFGSVYKCKKNHSNEDVFFAYKKLIQYDSESIARFRKEVNIIKKIENTSIIKIIDYNFDEVPYYVMPIYEKSLRLMINNIKNDYRQISSIFNKILNGLEYIHSNGIYHRDLKPENILINGVEDIVIADFGLGINTSCLETRLTKTGRPMYSPLYASPEQRKDTKHIDFVSADIYSLGIMIYESFIGKLKHTASYYVDFELDSLPEKIRELVEIATAKDPQKRYDSIEVFKVNFNKALDDIISDADVSNPINWLKILRFDNYDKDIIVNELLKNEKQIINDKKIIEHIVINFPLDVIGIIATKNILFLREIIERYIERIVYEAWAFNYLDIMAEKLCDIFKTVDDSKVRAKILYCLLYIGFSYKRPEISRKFLELAYSVQQNEVNEVIMCLTPIMRMLKSIKFDKERLNTKFSEWIT